MYGRVCAYHFLVSVLAYATAAGAVFVDLPSDEAKASAGAASGALAVAAGAQREAVVAANGSFIDVPLDLQNATENRKPMMSLAEEGDTANSGVETTRAFAETPDTASRVFEALADLVPDDRHSPSNESMRYAAASQSLAFRREVLRQALRHSSGMMLTSGHFLDRVGLLFSEQWRFEASASSLLEKHRVNALDDPTVADEPQMGADASTATASPETTDDDGMPLGQVATTALLIRLCVGALYLHATSADLIWSLLYSIMYWYKVTRRRRTLASRVRVKLPGADARVVEAMRTVGGLQPNSLSDFDVGLFDCCADVHYLAHGCCCGIPRASDTLRAAELMGFWHSIFFYCLMQVTANYGAYLFTKPGIPYFLILLATVVAWRMNYRRLLRQRYGGLPNYRLQDVFVVACCWYCSIIQEARFVDRQERVKVKCCFRFDEEELDFRGVVGDPVRLHGAVAVDEASAAGAGSEGAASGETGDAGGQGSDDSQSSPDPLLFSGKGRASPVNDASPTSDAQSPEEAANLAASSAQDSERRTEHTPEDTAPERVGD
mmetsp:Transcript_12160/g.28370  ORF Transcript_12160/g.28370 Transcript_12160/m.28370 type:complete len:550 (+) Transcript_12160:43-1692(+)